MVRKTLFSTPIYKVLIIAFFCYAILHFSESFITMPISETMIYIHQGFLIFGLIILGYAVKSSLKIFRSLYKIHDTVTSIIHFLFKKNKDSDIVLKIKSLIYRRSYKAALRMTSTVYQESPNILHYHLFLLLKLKKRSAFFSTVTKFQSGRSIELIMFYFKDLPMAKKLEEVRAVYSKNPDNAIFGYLAAYYSLQNKDSNAALRITKDFLGNKSILLDPYTAYKFHMLAIKIEKSLSGNDDHAINHLCAVDLYRKTFYKTI